MGNVTGRSFILELNYLCGYFGLDQIVENGYIISNVFFFFNSLNLIRMKLQEEEGEGEWEIASSNVNCINSLSNRMAKSQSYILAHIELQSLLIKCHQIEIYRWAGETSRRHTHKCQWFCFADDY